MPPIVGISEGVESGGSECAGPGNSDDAESDGSMTGEDRFFRRGIMHKDRKIVCTVWRIAPRPALLFPR